MHSRLHIISVEKGKISPSSPLPQKTRREEVQARFEREWHQNPQQFNPDRYCLEQERVSRTLALLSKYFLDKDTLSGVPGVPLLIADLGCGQGTLTRKIRDLKKGIEIHAVDIAKNALKELEKEEAILPIHACLPSTPLKDDCYDCVISTEVIGWLSPREHRLYFSELARLVKKGGFIVCSTRLDLNSEDPLGEFASLAETEIEILSWKCSYHRLYIRLKGLIEAPCAFHQASQNRLIKEKRLRGKEGFARWWFRLNSSKILGRLWGIIALFFRPVVLWVKKSRWLLISLEALSRLLFNERGISHALFIGKKRSLSKGFYQGKGEERELLIADNGNDNGNLAKRKGKRIVWE